MKANKKYLMMAMVAALSGMLLTVNGCKKSGSGAGKAVADSVQLCVGCGQIKGSDLCCKPGQPKCEKCGLAKGSPGCCNIPKGAESAAVCTKCGQMKGSALCCKPGQTKCGACGLVKGSPGCCKLPK